MVSSIESGDVGPGMYLYCKLKSLERKTNNMNFFLFPYTLTLYFYVKQINNDPCLSLPFLIIFKVKG